MLSIIVAVDENGLIGRQGRLPWHLPDDLRRFKQLTMGRAVVMGRRTWESIGRILPGRRMIVVSRQPGYQTGFNEVCVVADLPAALEICQVADDKQANDRQAFIIGGAELYSAAMPRVDRIYRTRVHTAVAGDTYFPEIEWQNWQLVESVYHTADVKHAYPFSFEVYDRT